MTALSTTTSRFSGQTGILTDRQFGTSSNSVLSKLDGDTRDVLSILGRTLFVLGLGAVGVVAITGQPPLFFLPLALFLFFGSCLQWRQTAALRPACANSGNGSGRDRVGAQRANCRLQ